MKRILFPCIISLFLCLSVTKADAFTKGHVTQKSHLSSSDTNVYLAFNDTVKSISCNVFSSSFYAVTSDSLDTVKGVSYSWQFTGGTPSTATGDTVTGIAYTGSGVYTVALYLIKTGDTLLADTGKILVSNNFTLIIAQTSPAICGDSATAIANVTGGTAPYTYSWSNGVTTKKDSTLVAGTYSCIVTPTAGCPDTTVITITNPPLVVAILPIKDSVCFGGSVHLSASGAVNYVWSPIASLSSMSGDTTTATPSITTIYKVVGSVGGCSDSAYATIKIFSAPPIIVTPGSGSICSGDSIQLNASGAANYAWSPTTGLSSTIQSTVEAIPASTTTYTVTGRSGGGCIDSGRVTVTVSSSITVSITGKDSVCKGSSTTLYASGSTNYNWSNGGTLDTIAVSPSTTTTYSLMVTSGTCKDSANVTVKVNNYPAPLISGPSSVCSGTTITLNGSGAGTYSWNNGATTSSINVVIDSNTTYQLTEDYNGCIKDTTLTVSTKPLPVVIVTPSSASSCTGDSATLIASGAFGYVWSTGSTNSSITVLPSVTTTYTVTGFSIPGCNASVTATVFVGQTSSISGNTTICSGSVTTLTASGGINYLWNTGATTSNITVSPSSTATYSVLVSSGTCKDSSNTTVTVNPAPIASLTTTSSSICSGNSVTLSASGGGTYAWSNGSSTSAITITPLSTTPYYVSVSNGVCTDTAKQTITVSPSPVHNATIIQGVCDGVSATMNTSGGGTYLWSTGSTTSTVTVTPTTTTLYTVTVSLGSCTTIDSSKVIVDPRAVGNVCCNTTIFIGTDTVITISPVVAGNTFDWVPSTGLSCVNCAYPVASPTATTTYTVTITDAVGCTRKDSVTIKVETSCGEVYVPNAFSPNGDGENDVLFVYGDCIETLDFAVFDRFGNEVFETQNKETGWDGKYNGVVMNTGVYVYTLKVTQYNGVSISKKGNVTLVR